MQVDFEIFDALAEQGWLTVRKHRTADLYIWNYTPQTVYKRYWTPETMMARGLITDGVGVVRARPFPKFFNLEELEGLGLSVPVEPFTVTEKVDGSLGILYFVDHVPYVATRGSFESEQAQHATALLHAKYLHNVDWYHLEREGITLLWEIVYPENRIVCDYGALDDLILLAAINNETGHEYNIVSFTNMRSHVHNAVGAQGDPVAVFPVVQHYDGLTNVHTIRDMFSGTSGTDSEGFVVRFQSGLRVKLKFAEYVRLHRLYTSFTAKTVWELLRSGQYEELQSILLSRDMYEDFGNWIENTVSLLSGQYAAVEESALGVYETVKGLPTRKEQAQTIAQYPHKAVVFKMLDEQPYADLIWKGLRPPAERPFKEQGEGVA